MALRMQPLAGLRRSLSLGALALSVDVFGASAIGVAPTAQTPTCFGRPATIVAETNDEWQEIKGTEGQDVIFVKGGALIAIDALGGNDLICGGAQELDAGPGNDQMVGVFGFVSGGSGDDYVFNERNFPVNPGHGTVLNGDEGNDIIVGSNFNDRYDGDSANTDFLNGGPGNDTIRGRNGDDVISGGDGDDRIIAGAHNDDIDGGAGRDNCDGGKNRDTATGCEIRTNIP